MSTVELFIVDDATDREYIHACHEPRPRLFAVIRLWQDHSPTKSFEDLRVVDVYTIILASAYVVQP